jgi:hypothetical protein
MAGDVARLQPAAVGEAEVGLRQTKAAGDGLRAVASSVGLRAIWHRATEAASDKFLSHTYGLVGWSRWLINTIYIKCTRTKSIDMLSFWVCLETALRNKQATGRFLSWHHYNKTHGPQSTAAQPGLATNGQPAAPLFSN